MRRLKRYIPFIGLLSLAVAVPAFAITVYSQDVSVISTVAYVNTPIITASNNTFLAANSYMQADGLDAQIQSGGAYCPTLIADNQTVFANGLSIGTNTFQFKTKQTPLTSMPMVLGNGGYITLADNAALEPSANFSLGISGYIDTAAGTSKYLVNKSGSVVIDAGSTAAGNVTAKVLVPDTLNTTVSTTNNFFGIAWKAQTFTPAVTGNLTDIQILMGARTGAPAGAVTVSLRATLAGVPSGADITSGSLTSITDSAYNTWTFTTPAQVTAGTMYALVIRHPTGDAGNFYTYQDSGVNPYAGGTECSSGDSGGTWASIAAGDIGFKTFYGTTLSTTVAAGIHGVNLTANSVTLDLKIDGVSQASTGFAGTLSNTADNWLFMQNNVMSYADNITLSIGGNPSVQFQPNAIIVGTALPNRANGALNGVITWGTNPALTISYGSFLPISQPSGALPNTSVGVKPDVIPSNNVTYTGAVAAPVSPISPYMQVFAILWGVTELNIWFFTGMILALMAFFLVAVIFKHVGFALIAADSVIALFTMLNVYPKGVFILVAIILVAGIVSETRQ